MDPPTYPFEETSFMDGPLLKTPFHTFSVSNQPGQYFMWGMGFLGQPKIQEAYNIINF